MKKLVMVMLMSLVLMSCNKETLEPEVNIYTNLKFTVESYSSYNVIIPNHVINYTIDSPLKVYENQIGENEYTMYDGALRTVTIENNDTEIINITIEVYGVVYEYEVSIGGYITHQLQEYIKNYF